MEKSRIRDKHLGSATLEHTLLKIFFGLKLNNSLKIGPSVFLYQFQNNIILNFVKFVAAKKYDNKFFSPLFYVTVLGSGIRDPGSVMGKNQDTGSRINIPDPPH